MSSSCLRVLSDDIPTNNWGVPPLFSPEAETNRIVDEFYLTYLGDNKFLTDDLGLYIWRKLLVDPLQSRLFSCILHEFLGTCMFRCLEGSSATFSIASTSLLRDSILSFFACDSFSKLQASESLADLIVNASGKFYEDMLVERDLLSLPFCEFLTHIYHVLSFESLKFQELFRACKFPDGKVLHSDFYSRVVTVVLQPHLSYLGDNVELAFIRRTPSELELVFKLANLLPACTSNDLLSTAYERTFKSWIRDELSLRKKTMSELCSISVTHENDCHSLRLSWMINLCKEYEWYLELLKLQNDSGGKTVIIKKAFEPLFERLLNDRFDSFDFRFLLSTLDEETLKALTLNAPKTIAQYFDLLIKEDYQGLLTSSPINGAINQRVSLLLQILPFIANKEEFQRSYLDRARDRIVDRFRSIPVCLDKSALEIVARRERGALTLERWVLSRLNEPCTPEFIKKLEVIYVDYHEYLNERLSESTTAILSGVDDDLTPLNIMVANSASWNFVKTTVNANSFSPSKDWLEKLLHKYRASWKKKNPKKQLDFLDNTFNFDICIGLPCDNSIKRLEIFNLDLLMFDIMSFLCKQGSYSTFCASSTMAELFAHLRCLSEANQQNVNYNVIFLKDNGILNVSEAKNISSTRISINCNLSGPIRLEVLTGVTESIGTYKFDINRENYLLGQDSRKEFIGLQTLAEVYIMKFMKSQYAQSSKNGSSTDVILQGLNSVASSSKVLYGIVNFRSSSYETQFKFSYEMAFQAIENLVKKGFLEVLPSRSDDKATEQLYIYSP